MNPSMKRKIMIINQHVNKHAIKEKQKQKKIRTLGF